MPNNSFEERICVRVRVEGIRKVYAKFQNTDTEVNEMKKRFMALSITVMLVLGGCAIVEEVNNTVTYVKEATEYVNEASRFVKEVPSLAEQAVNDKQALAGLETKLEEMKEEMERFIGIQAPEIAAELHQQIIDHTRKAKEGIDVYLNNIKDGTLDPKVLANTGLIKSMQEITKIIEQIKQLGQ